MQCVYKKLVTILCFCVFISSFLAAGEQKNVKFKAVADWRAINIKGKGGNFLDTNLLLDFNISKKDINNLTHGVWVKIPPLNSAYKIGRFVKAEGIFYLKGGFGRVELGSFPGVNNNMQINALNFSKGGGIAKREFQYYEGYQGDSALKAPNFLSNAHHREDVKINYYSQFSKNIRFGISYLPNLRYGKAVFQKYPRYKNVISGSLEYLKYFDTVGFRYALSLEHAKSSYFNNFKGVNNGIKVEYLNWGLASSYGKNYNFPVHIEGKQKVSNIHFWTLGISWKQGPIGISVVNFTSRDRKHNGTFRSNVVGVEYKLKQNVAVYAEHLSSKECQARSPQNLKNKVYLLGLKMDLMLINRSF